jgi:transposase-like protein
MDTFAEKYDTKYGNAVACLTRDRDALLAFFDFPAEHWDHRKRPATPPCPGWGASDSVRYE